MNEKTPDYRRTVARRSVVKAAAWSVPLVAVAVALPAASASGNGLVAAWNPSAMTIHRHSSDGPFSAPHGTATLVVTNDTSQVLTAMTVHITSLGGNVDVINQVTGAGWSWGTGGGGSGTVLWTGNLQPGESTAEGEFSFTSEDPVGTGSTSFVATPEAAGSVAQQATLAIDYNQEVA